MGSFRKTNTVPRVASLCSVLSELPVFDRLSETYHETCSRPPPRPVVLVSAEINQNHPNITTKPDRILRKFGLRAMTQIKATKITFARTDHNMLTGFAAVAAYCNKADAKMPLSFFINALQTGQLRLPILQHLSDKTQFQGYCVGLPLSSGKWASSE